MTTGVGPVTEYEASFARQVGAAHAVSFGFARTAIVGLCRAAGLGTGDEVVLSPLTCQVVPLALLSLGLVPRYADLEPATLNLSPAVLDRARTERTRAVLFQRTYGLSTNVERVAAWARKENLFLIEDSAHSIPGPDAWLGEGSATGGAVFSNNAGKPVPAGSGGIAITNAGPVAEALRRFQATLPEQRASRALAARAANWVRNRVAVRSRYWMAFDLVRRFDPGYRSQPITARIAAQIEGGARRIGPVEARAGASWMERHEVIRAHRARRSEDYYSALTGREGIELPAAGRSEPLYWFPALVPRKRELLERARRDRIEIVPWPISTPIYPIEDPAQLAGFGYRPGSCPEAERVADRLVGLPTHGSITESDAARTTRLVLDHLERT